MEDDMHPLPQRPRRAFSAKPRAPGGSSEALAAEHVEVRTAQIPSIHNASGQVGGGRGAQISEEGRSDCGVDGSGSHISKGIADGCGYDEAVQYVGEGGDRPLAEGEIRKYEYLDHTADVQFHSWGDSIEEAFEQMVVCMFSYITDLHTVDTTDELLVEVSGHDMQSVLYNYMDEFLFQFCTEGFVARRVSIVAFDKDAFSITAKGFGEKFQARVKHPQGTEIKAITYSAMQIHTKDTGASDVYVIVDI